MTSRARPALLQLEALLLTAGLPASCSWADVSPANEVAAMPGKSWETQRCEIIFLTSNHDK